MFVFIFLFNPIFSLQMFILRSLVPESYGEKSVLSSFSRYEVKLRVKIKK